MRRVPALLTALAVAVLLALALAHALRSLLVATLLATPAVSSWALPRAPGAPGAVALLVLLTLLARVVFARLGGVLGLALVFWCAPLASLMRKGHAAHEEEDPCAD